MITEPNYDRDVAKLVDAYKRAITAILAELNRLDLSEISRANAQVALSEVTKILSSLNEESAQWVKANIPKAATDGIIRTLIDIGVVKTVEEAQKIVKFNRINREMVASAVADTQADLLAVTQNVDRKVRAAVRQATADSFRANMTAGINGRRTISRDILTQMRKTLGDSVNTGLIDAAGRRWKPEVYVEMMTRTKMMQTQIDATINEALGRDVQYGVISRHGAKDDCQLWEGRVIKLTPDAPGDYPYIGDLPRRQIFHPNCKHVVSPVRDPESML
ncbi:phage minor capsid protein [Paenibacillus sediminis]|uniref:Minor capsid protein n=1 Tax=Paenibacillus sediminis TaxID=664909 RepID=A0ABS4H6M7_9BACL|nr:phage minor capsid protein [Paenibacillus sediminis]MBP1938188.1 hypothetical protein [Paenibacillus sediminis]